MNDIETVDQSITIAAVVFCGMNKTKWDIEITGDKPYFYLNTIGATEGEYVLVGSTGWNVVKVLRLIPTTHVNALAKVTACLIGHVQYDADQVSGASKKLLEFQLRTSEQRLQKQIDKEIDDMDDVVEELRAQIGARRRKVAKPIEYPSTNPDDDF